MAKLRVHNFTISLDGYAAGPNQTAEKPFGDGFPESAHNWMFAAMERETPDTEFAKRWDANIGATIMGRNMFGPIRDAWGDTDWKGWWGENPPYHHPTFVLTNHARNAIEMEGGTTFAFVTDGIEAALERAVEAANGQDVCLAGGANAIQQYLRAGLIDELNIAIVPILVGGGERLFDNLGDALDRYEIARHVNTEAATHVQLVRR